MPAINTYGPVTYGNDFKDYHLTANVNAQNAKDKAKRRAKDEHANWPKYGRTTVVTAAGLEGGVGQDMAVYGAYDWAHKVTTNGRTCGARQQYQNAPWTYYDEEGVGTIEVAGYNRAATKALVAGSLVTHLDDAY
ncbi:hypothetical protein ACU6U9_12475 [Pseudomonas sp. HK3]